MLAKVKIIVNEMEPYREKYALWSILFVQVDDVCFPSQQWNDATSAVLSVWVQEMIRLITGVTDQVRLPFMDGDFEVVLNRLEQENISSKFIKSESIVMWEDNLDIRYFARQLLSATSKLEVYYAKNFDSYQMKQLTSGSNQLRAVMNKSFTKNTLPKNKPANS